MANDVFTQRLKSLENTWKQAQAAAGESSFGTVVPDGRYVSVISQATIGESQSSGRLQIAWEYVISEGEFTGEAIRDYDGLETEMNLTWLGRKLSRLGYDFAAMGFSDLPAVLEDILKSKPSVLVRLRTKGEYQNAYIEKLLSTDTPESSPSEDTSQETVEVYEEAGPSLQVGMQVAFRYQKDIVTGTIVRFFDENTAAVRLPEGKVLRIQTAGLTPTPETMEIVG
jgi:hypothetical protein